MTFKKIFKSFQELYEWSCIKGFIKPLNEFEERKIETEEEIAFKHDFESQIKYHIGALKFNDSVMKDLGNFQGVG